MKNGLLVTLDNTLNELQEVDPRAARILEMRHFGGLSVEETAAALGISEETVTRDWRLPLFSIGKAPTVRRAARVSPSTSSMTM